MSCEHPTCSVAAMTICQHHCHLQLCQLHRLEHEKNLLNEFEKQLDQLTRPISHLLHQSRIDLRNSEESRQRELNRINALFDQHLASITQRLQLSKIAQTLIESKREQLLKCQNGDHQLTKEDYQHLQHLSNNMQDNLQDQYQLTNDLRNQHRRIDGWTTNGK